MVIRLKPSPGRRVQLPGRASAAADATNPPFPLGASHRGRSGAAGLGCGRRLPGHDQGRRRAAAGRARTDLALLRSGRAQLRHHEGRPEAARGAGAARAAPVYFRAHNLLTSGDGTPALKWGSTNAYTEEPEGRPPYDRRILDRVFDTYPGTGLQA